MKGGACKRTDADRKSFDDSTVVISENKKIGLYVRIEVPDKTVENLGAEKIKLALKWGM